MGKKCTAGHNKPKPAPHVPVEKSSSYKVSPGHPPKDGRFKLGQSGNPKGRPKGSKNFGTVVDKQLRKKVTMAYPKK